MPPGTSVNTQAEGGGFVKEQSMAHLTFHKVLVSADRDLNRATMAEILTVEDPNMH